MAHLEQIWQQVGAFDERTRGVSLSRALAVAFLQTVRVDDLITLREHYGIRADSRGATAADRERARVSADVLQRLRRFVSWDDPSARKCLASADTFLVDLALSVLKEHPELQLSKATVDTLTGMCRTEETHNVTCASVLGLVLPRCSTEVVRQVLSDATLLQACQTSVLSDGVVAMRLHDAFLSAASSSESVFRFWKTSPFAQQILSLLKRTDDVLLWSVAVALLPKFAQSVPSANLLVQSGILQQFRVALTDEEEPMELTLSAVLSALCDFCDTWRLTLEKRGGGTDGESDGVTQAITQAVRPVAMHFDTALAMRLRAALDALNAVDTSLQIFVEKARSSHSEIDTIAALHAAAEVIPHSGSSVVRQLLQFVSTLLPRPLVNVQHAALHCVQVAAKTAPLAVLSTPALPELLLDRDATFEHAAMEMKWKIARFLSRVLPANDRHAALVARFAEYARQGVYYRAHVPQVMTESG